MRLSIKIKTISTLICFKIEQMIRELTCRPELSVSFQSSTSLKSEVSENLEEPIRQIRIAISILFYFLRKSIQDKVKNEINQNFLYFVYLVTLSINIIISVVLNQNIIVNFF